MYFAGPRVSAVGAGGALIRFSSNTATRSTKCRRAVASSTRGSADRGMSRGQRKIHAPELIEIRKETPLWNDHLFVNDSGKFGWKVNTWEDTVLREEMKGKTFAGWLRNIPKKHWALCVPYGQGEAKPMYPDLLVFRREGNKIKIDILDPHDDARGDAAEKAAGLANFARKHGAAFGRIEMIRIVKGQVERFAVT